MKIQVLSSEVHVHILRVVGLVQQIAFFACEFNIDFTCSLQELLDPDSYLFNSLVSIAFVSAFLV